MDDNSPNEVSGFSSLLNVVVDLYKNKRNHTDCPLCVSLSLRGGSNLSRCSCGHRVTSSGLDQSGSTSIGLDAKVGGAILWRVRAASNGSPSLSSVGSVGPSVTDIDRCAGSRSSIGGSGHGDGSTGLSVLGQVGHLSGRDLGE
jgi:hypothetical protein